MGVSELGGVGRNGAQEFAETILYMTMYDEANGFIKQATDSVDNQVVKEAIQSGLTVIAFGAVFYLIRLEEKWLNKVIDKTVVIVMPILASANGLMKKGLAKAGGKMGNGRLAKFLRSMSARNGAEVQVQTARAVMDGSKLVLDARHNNNQTVDKMNLITNAQSNAMRKENTNLNIAKAHTDSYQQNLMFKLFSKNFTDKDKVILQKITGKPGINIEDMNTIADFMFVTDNEGNITGLSQTIVELLNGLGYINK